MFNFFTTITNAIEHTTIKKTFGSYKNAALIEGNINLLHKLQDEKLCNSRFIEPEETLFTLDQLLEPEQKPESKDILLEAKKKEEKTKSEDMKEAFIEWFKSLDDENKKFIKDAMK